MHPVTLGLEGAVVDRGGFVIDREVMHSTLEGLLSIVRCMWSSEPESYPCCESVEDPISWTMQDHHTSILCLENSLPYEEAAKGRGTCSITKVLNLSLEE